MKKILAVIAVMGFMEHCKCIEEVELLRQTNERIQELTQARQDLMNRLEVCLGEGEIYFVDIPSFCYLLKVEDAPDALRFEVLPKLRQIRETGADLNYRAHAALILHIVRCRNCDCYFKRLSSDSSGDPHMVARMNSVLNAVHSLLFGKICRNLNAEEIAFLIDFFCPFSSFDDANNPACIVKAVECAAKYLLDNEDTTRPDLMVKIIQSCCQTAPSSKKKFLELLLGYANSGNLSAIRLHYALTFDWTSAMPEKAVMDFSQSTQRKLAVLLDRLNNIISVDENTRRNTRRDGFFYKLGEIVENRANFINLIEEMKGMGFSIGAMKEDIRRKLIDFTLRVVLQVPSPKNVIFLKEMLIHMPADMYFKVIRVLKVLEGDGNIEGAKLLYFYIHNETEMPPNEIEKLRGLLYITDESQIPGIPILGMENVPPEDFEQNRQYQAELRGLIETSPIDWLKNLPLQERQEALYAFFQTPLAASGLLEALKTARMRGFPKEMRYVLPEKSEEVVREKLEKLVEEDGPLLGMEGEPHFSDMRTVSSFAKCRRLIFDRERNFFVGKGVGSLGSCPFAVSPFVRSDLLGIVYESESRPLCSWIEGNSLGNFPGNPGWKIHISAVPDSALRVAQAVIPILGTYGVHYKIMDSLLIMRSFYAPYRMNIEDPLVGLDFKERENYLQMGKYITIYPENAFQANLIVKKIDLAFKAVNLVGPRYFVSCLGDIQAGDTGGIFIRWCKSYSQDGVDIERAVPCVDNSGPCPYGDKASDEERRRFFEFYNYLSPEWCHPFEVELSYLGKILGRKVSEWGFHERSTFEEMGLLAPGTPR
ncbi:MAG: hypothetical protein LBJ96_05475 [Holosporaceae bacterium]|jgi:hypothetical protein|nr:hypothetical protein [Holosporaceae bacterium]